MDTLVLERDDRLIFTNVARVVRSTDEVGEDFANAINWDSADTKNGNPYIKWIAGNFVEADNPNRNTQFWTKEDLALGEYTIKYAPLNMLHKNRNPVGFFLATKTVELEHASQGSAKIQALSGMWTHLFPFESAMVDKADGDGLLFYSMECRGSHLHCAGPNGCDQIFDYGSDDLCEHLKERSSYRHIMNPVFRGGALIIPPTQPGWAEANAQVLEKALLDEAARFAEQNETAMIQLNSAGHDLSASQWELLMAQIVSSSER